MIELNNTNFDTTVSDGVTLVDFYAPWCGPCRMVAPVLEIMSSEFEGKAKITKVNVDENQDLAMRYGIRSIPTILIFKKGELVDTIVGATSKENMTDKLNSLI